MPRKLNQALMLEQFPLVKWFIFHLIFYRTLHPFSKKLNSTFWVFSIDSHLAQATIYWNMVFGAETNNPTHWKWLVDDESERVDLGDTFTKSVLQKTGWKNKDEWTAYWTDMVSFRNNYVVHRDKFKGKVPSFDKALEVAFAYDEWIRDLFPGAWGEPPLERSVAEAEKMVKQFLETYSEVNR